MSDPSAFFAYGAFFARERPEQVHVLHLAAGGDAKTFRWSDGAPGGGATT